MREIPAAPPAPARPQVPPGSTPPTRDVLVAQLRNEDGDVRVAAARELGRRGDPIAVPALIAALRDANSAVRIAAAHALGKLRDGGSVESLAGAMSSDADGNVQAAARVALEAIGTPAAETVLAEHDARRAQAERDAEARANPQLDRTRGVEGLLDALRGPHERLQAEAAEALSEAGPAAVEPLAALLADESVWVRKRTAELLARIGDARAAEPLRAALDAIPTEDRSYETFQFRDAARRALAAVSIPVAAPEPPLDFDELSRVAASRDDVAPSEIAAPALAKPQAEDPRAAMSARSDPALAQLSDDQLGERLLEIARAALGGGRPPLDSYDARRAIARSIGEAFHRRGGLDAMRNALDQYVGDLPGRHPIDQSWDGVGEWMG
ncbi:MAG: HEAT repeat domain-containing protein [Planctomycetota bacterium]|nr:HEAT repeat domain-containing protein [Planctomycetota bacterium]